jgi:hypothetical protein
MRRVRTKQWRRKFKRIGCQRPCRCQQVSQRRICRHRHLLPSIRPESQLRFSIASYELSSCKALILILAVFRLLVLAPLVSPLCLQLQYPSFIPSRPLSRLVETILRGWTRQWKSAPCAVVIDDWGERPARIPFRGLASERELRDRRHSKAIGATFPIRPTTFTLRAPRGDSTDHSPPLETSAFAT